MAKLPIVDQVISLVRKTPPSAAAAPRDRDARLRTAFDRAPVGIACVAIDGRWLQFNERFREMVGYTRDQLARLTFNDLTHPDDAKSEAPLVRRLLRGDLPAYRIEKRIIEKKGRYRDVIVSASLVPSDGADFLIYIVDDPHHGMSAARENEQLLAGMIERMTELAVIRTDEKGTIVGWNAGAERVFGYRRDEMIGKPRRMLYRDPDNWEGKATHQLGAAGDVGRIELDDWRVAKDGSHVWVHTSITTVRADGEVAGYIEVVSPPGGLAGRGAQQFRAAAEAKLAELRNALDDSRNELTRRERTEESLRHALEELRVVGEETMNELRIMTVALRDEIDRRKRAEDEVRVLKAAPPPAPEPPPVETPVTGPMPPARAWKKMKSLSPAELLVQHASKESTGRLLFTRGEEEIEIFFENGKVLAVSSSDPSRFLTQRLIALGMLTEEQRRKALEIQRETHLALGRILMILGAVTEEQLLHVARAKAEDEIERVIRWDDGKFAFVETEIPTQQIVPLRLDVAALVVQRLNRPAATSTPLAADTPLAAEIRSMDEELPRLANAFDDGTPLAIELEPPPESPAGEELLVASASGKSKKFHRTSCPNAKRFDEDTRVIFTSVEAALHAGYDACRVCFR